MIREFMKWLNRVTIKQKLYFVISIMALLIAAELYMLSFTIHTLSATRAMVGGESLYSKAQKDAIYSLREYGSSLDEEDYDSFLRHLRVNHGYRNARKELEKEHFNQDAVFRSLLEGKGHPDDISEEISFFRKFRQVSYVDKAIQIWAKGDSLMNKLEELGEQMHNSAHQLNKSREGFAAWIRELHLLNLQLTALEAKFSYTLGEGSRWLESLILRILFLVALTVECSGLFLTISVSSGITKGVQEIIRSSRQVAKSDFQTEARVFSGDEIGELARAFNQMVGNLRHKTELQQQTELDLIRQKELYETLVFAQSEMGEGMIITRGPAIVYVNDALCRMYGYTEKELLEMPTYFQLIPDLEQQRIAQRITDKEKGQLPAKGETMIKKKNGELIQIEYTSNVIKMGDTQQLVSIVRDITEHKKTEHKIAELAAIVQASGDAIISKSMVGSILSWNAGAEHLYGYKAEEIIGNSFSMLCFPGETEELWSLLDEATGHEQVKHYEARRIRKDGAVVDVSITLSPIMGPDGKVSVISTIDRDISRRKKAETDLQTKSSELARSNTELEQFAYIASHDLREPLRTVKGYIQLLDDRHGGSLNEEAREFVSLSMEGVKRMERLISDLLTYSRTGYAPMQTEQVDTTEMLGLVLNHLKEMITRNEAVITYDPLPVIQANELQIIQLFQNLISNAISFRGQETPRIHISAIKSPEGGWLFSVSDNGIGIEKKHLERIFIIFQRLETKGSYTGTGIGLAICKKIVERMNGKIWAESEPGKGSIFYFTVERNEGTC